MPRHQSKEGGGGRQLAVIVAPVRVTAPITGAGHTPIAPITHITAECLCPTTSIVVLDSAAVAAHGCCMVVVCGMVVAVPGRCTVKGARLAVATRPRA